jgi:hypothetical protein
MTTSAVDGPGISQQLEARDDTQAWQDAHLRLLAAVEPDQRCQVERLCTSLHNGGGGLREWISAIARGATVLPDSIPPELIRVYVCDPEAVPLHDCEECGLAVPVRPNRLHGLEASPEQVYFPKCPKCGARTGQYYYWSRQAETNSVINSLRRRKPR